jgi:hypothetical protein
VDREIISFLEQGNKNDSKLAALQLMLEFGSAEDKRKAMREVSNLAVGASDANETHNDDSINDTNSSVTKEEDEEESSVASSENGSSN